MSDFNFHNSDDDIYHSSPTTPPHELFYASNRHSNSQSDATTLYLSNNSSPRPQPKDKAKESAVVTSVPHSNNSSTENLESQPELHNEKRLFSFLFSKKVPPITASQDRKPYPWKHANLISRGIFMWLYPILLKGYKRTLYPNDIYYLTDDLMVENMHAKFDKILRAIIERAEIRHLKDNTDLSNFAWPKHAIPLAIFKTFPLQYSSSCIFLAIAFCCQGLSPLIMRELIDFVENVDRGAHEGLPVGVGYTLGAVGLIYLNGVLLNHFFHNAMITGAQAKAILSRSLLLKSFKLDSKGRNKFPVGRITSLMTTDLSRIDLAIGYQPLVVCFPIPIILAVILLIHYIGATAVSGILLFFVSLTVCVLLTKKLFTTREAVVDFTDERISLMREILSNLKVIKFYAWELAYKLKITQVRSQETRFLFTIKVVRNFITAYAVTLPVLTSMFSFVIMWALDEMKSPGAIFSSLTLFAILAQAIMLLPIALATGADALIGFKRLNEFFGCNDYDAGVENRLQYYDDKFVIGDDNASETSINPFAEKDFSIKVEHANFVWDGADASSIIESLKTDNKFTKKEKAKMHYQRRKEYEKALKLIDKGQHPKQLALANHTSGSSSQSSENYDQEKFDYKNHNVTLEQHSVDSNSEVNAFSGLNDINLAVRKQEFIVITGVIGSGKSSLLNALAGFMSLKSGSLKIHDRLLLCSIPWIQNTTIRENITFGSKFDPIKYSEVIHACALEDDLKSLPARDMTEISERGVTLSGGQKARINLARAAYANPDTILLDDVLSAVDAKVGRHIIDNLFEGLLKNKTRILATHQLSLIDDADRVIFLNGDGTVDIGTIEELNRRNAAFRTLFEFSLQNATKGSKDDNKQGENKNKQSESSPDFHSDGEQFGIEGRQTVEESRGNNSMSWDVYKKYINLGSGILGPIAPFLFVIILALATACQLFTNVWLSYWVDRRVDLQDKYYVLAYVLLAIGTVFLTALEFVLLAYMNSKSAEVLNVKAMEKILHAPMSFIDTNPMGRLLNRFTKDTDSLDNELGEQLKLFIFPLGLIIGIVLLCISFLPYFAIAVPFFVFAFVLISNFYQATSREIKRLEALQRSVVYNNFNETLTGMSTIKAYNMEDSFLKKNDDYINKMNEAYFLSIATQRWLSAHIDIIAACFALIIGMLCVTDTLSISASSTGLLFSYVIQIVALLSLTVRSMTQVDTEMNAVERVYDYAFNLEQEAAYKKSEFAPPPEWPQSGYIQFSNVYLRYRPRLPYVLKDLNFSIYPGEKIGICGRTGAGKSSIMTALYRLSELETGNIFIDGVDISQLGLYDLRSKLSIIPQDPVLFKGSIRRNLDPFDEHNDEVLWDALRRSGLIEGSQLARVKQSRFNADANITFENLHKFHIDQLVEDDGENFSLGERQLIALARALVRNSKILILDEATASVDYETDHRIQQTIQKEFSHCTILCIAHRLKTILNYDRILVMDRGEVIEKGTPIDLYRHQGVFKSMCDKASIKTNDFN